MQINKQTKIFENSNKLKLSSKSESIKENKDEEAPDKEQYFVYGSNEFCFVILNNFDKPKPATVDLETEG